jgi:hypothetical protein
MCEKLSKLPVAPWVWVLGFTKKSSGRVAADHRCAAVPGLRCGARAVPVPGYGLASLRDGLERLERRRYFEVSAKSMVLDLDSTWASRGVVR